ncbi:MAG: hypothetical protein P8N99_05410 [Luminiphilus sp.]|nr:hypothetical protein [Luminiphilus sp.]
MQKRIHASCALTLSAFISVAAQAQTGDAEIDPMEALFNSNQSGGAGKVEGQSCYDYLDRKGWSDGFNEKRDGTPYFVSVGVSRVQAPWQSSNFATSMMNASIAAQLETKSNLAQTMGKEITSQITSELLQDYTEGTAPEIAEASQPPATTTYDELGYYEKFKLLVNQQLDKAIDQETKDAFDDKALSAAEAEEALRRVVNTQSFNDAITARSNATIRGMKNIFTSFDSSAKKNSTVACVVGLWSEKLAQQVDAMTTGNYDLLKGQKAGMPLDQYIGSENTREGFTKLLGTYGTFIVRNEKGEISVLSYAQAGIKGSMGEQPAFNEAKLRAERAIIQLREEHVDVVQASSNQESSVEYDDGMIDYYSRSKNESRVTASASGTLDGSSVKKRWRGSHLNQKPFVGVVVAWTPSGAELADTARETMANKPQPKSAAPAQPVAAPQWDGGAGAAVGDDEDDF